MSPSAGSDLSLHSFLSGWFSRNWFVGFDFSLLVSVLKLLSFANSVVFASLSDMKNPPCFIRKLFSSLFMRLLVPLAPGIPGSAAYLNQSGPDQTCQNQTVLFIHKPTNQIVPSCCRTPWLHQIPKPQAEDRMCCTVRWVQVCDVIGYDIIIQVIWFDFFFFSFFYVKIFRFKLLAGGAPPQPGSLRSGHNIWVLSWLIVFPGERRRTRLHGNRIVSRKEIWNGIKTVNGEQRVGFLVRWASVC